MTFTKTFFASLWPSFVGMLLILTTVEAYGFEVIASLITGPGQPELPDSKARLYSYEPMTGNLVLIGEKELTAAAPVTFTLDPKIFFKSDVYAVAFSKNSPVDVQKVDFYNQPALSNDLGCVVHFSLHKTREAEKWSRPIVDSNGTPVEGCEIAWLRAYPVGILKDCGISLPKSNSEGLLDLSWFGDHPDLLNAILEHPTKGIGAIFEREYRLDYRDKITLNLPTHPLFKVICKDAKVDLSQVVVITDLAVNGDRFREVVRVQSNGEIRTSFPKVEERHFRFVGAPSFPIVENSAFVRNHQIQVGTWVYGRVVDSQTKRPGLCERVGIDLKGNRIEESLSWGARCDPWGNFRMLLPPRELTLEPTASVDFPKHVQGIEVTPSNFVKRTRFNVNRWGYTNGFAPAEELVLEHTPSKYNVASNLARTVPGQKIHFDWNAKQRIARASKANIWFPKDAKDVESRLVDLTFHLDKPLSLLQLPLQTQPSLESFVESDLTEEKPLEIRLRTSEGKGLSNLWVKVGPFFVQRKTDENGNILIKTMNPASKFIVDVFSEKRFVELDPSKDRNTVEFVVSREPSVLERARQMGKKHYGLRSELLKLDVIPKDGWKTIPEAGWLFCVLISSWGDLEMRKIRYAEELSKIYDIPAIVVVDNRDGFNPPSWTNTLVARAGVSIPVFSNFTLKHEDFPVSFLCRLEADGSQEFHYFDDPIGSSPEIFAYMIRSMLIDFAADSRNASGKNDSE